MDEHAFQPRSNRIKIWHVEPRDVAFIFNFFARREFDYQYFRMPLPVGIPKTARVLSVHHDVNNRSLAVMLEDESFEEVPEGERAPSVHFYWDEFQQTATRVDFLADLGANLPLAERTDLIKRLCDTPAIKMEFFAKGTG